MASYICRDSSDRLIAPPVGGPIHTGYSPGHWATIHLHDIWSGIRQKLSRIPSVKDLDLMRLYRVAPYMSVLEIEPQGGRLYLTRFWGTELVHMFGFEATGKHLVDIATPETTNCLTKQFEAVLHSGEPCLYHDELSCLRAQTGAAFEVLHVPLLSGQGETVARIASVFGYDDGI